MFLFKNFFYCLLTFRFNNMREVAQLVEQSFFLLAASSKPGSYLFNGHDGLPVRVRSSRLNWQMKFLFLEILVLSSDKKG